MSLALTFSHADACDPGEPDGRYQRLDWESPRVGGLLTNTPWPIQEEHPARLMHELTSDFLTECPADTPPRELLLALVDALQGGLIDLANCAEPDEEGTLDFGGNVALTATDGQALWVARAGDIRVVSLDAGHRILQHENTLAGDQRAAGAVVDAPDNVVTAFLGGGHIPHDLLVEAPLDGLRRLVFCAEGAVRHLEPDQVDTLGSNPDAQAAALSLIEAGRAAAERSGDQAPSMGVCVVTVAGRP